MTDSAIEADAPTPAPVRRNTAMIALIVIGALLIVIGAIVGFAAGHQAAFDSEVNLFENAGLGLPSDTPSSKVAADTGWMIAGIVGAVLGAVCLIGAGIAAAVRSK